MRVRNFVIVALFILASIVITYWNLPKTFFQQDEWWAFGIFIRREQAGGLVYFLRDIALTSGRVHFNPLTELGLYVQYKIFDMNFVWYAWVSIFTHLLNVFLIYVFTRKILRNKYFAFLSAILFGINSISHQAVTWIAASLNTQGSTLFILLAALLFLEYLRDEKRKKNLYLSFVCVIVALLFKEVILPFFMLPMFFLLYSRKKTLQQIKKTFFPLVIFIAIYATLRIFVFFVANPIVLGVNSSGLSTGIGQYLFRIVLLPFRVIAQSIIPSRLILQGSNIITTFSYPHFVSVDGMVNPYFSETITYDLICILITSLMLFASYFVYRFFSQKRLSHLATGLVVSIFVIIGGALPIVFVSDRAGFASIMEPRHLYTGMFGATMLIVLLLSGLSLALNKKVSLVILSVFLFLLSILHISLVKSDLNVLKTNSDIRKSILTKIVSDYPTLPNPVIFYTQSDRPYYGLPVGEEILPVQVGFGRILLVWYERNEKFPGCLFDDTFLLDITAEGYKECSGWGFGYVRKYQTLLQILRDNKLTSANVIGYSWESEKQTFHDISAPLRVKIGRDL